MTTITFMRHAQTEYNTKGLFCGTSDCSITQEGANEAHKLRDELPKFDFYYCSPLRRTWETLHAIFPDVDFTVDSRVVEICLGTWEGIPKTSVNQDLRKAFKSGNYTPKGAESSESVQSRIKSFLSFIFETYTHDEKILVVTHNGFLRELARLIGVPPVTKNLEYLTVDSSLLIFKE